MYSPTLNQMSDHEWEVASTEERERAIEKYYGTMPFRSLWLLNGAWFEPPWDSDFWWNFKEQFIDRLIDYDLEYPGHVKSMKDLYLIYVYFIKQGWLTVHGLTERFFYPLPTE